MRLRIAVATPGARVTLDGAALGKNPFEAMVNQDNAIHQVVATAPGHETLTRAVVFDSDQTLELSLTPSAQDEPAPTASKRRTLARRARRLRRARRGARPAEPRPVTTKARPEPGAEMQYDAKARQPIDDEDPYL